jgi:hypothetical protein
MTCICNDYTDCHECPANENESEEPAELETPRPFCSFCGKSQAEVDRMIAGPAVYICQSCNNLVTKLFKENSP